MLENKNKLLNAFPSILAENIEAIYRNASLTTSLDHTPGIFKVIVNNETLAIPGRVYLTEMSYAGYTIVQQSILDCYYTRHSDGFIREKHLKQIISSRHEWVVPYVIKILGEYVIEILDVIYKELDNLDLAMYRNFIENNRDFYILTKQRVASYWNCYYRWLYENKSDYVGFKIIDFIDTKVLK